MKILKLTILNMASLEGEHVIDFNDEPLKSTGLFSIVGDTGSGKSTILDAICLALYGLAPRFFDSKKIDYYSNEKKNNDRYLQPDDPRNILRRGMKECSSEVVFLARDNKKYRARWACSFARTNYNDPERSLYKIVTDDDGKKKEIKIEISNARGYGRKNVPNDNLNCIIGLDYNQFTRTALLAQNSFANFLKADAKDKALLLEMLTGTELYTKVAKKIYERFKNAESSYYELENTLKGIRANLQTDERIEQLRQQSVELDKEMTGLRERQERLKKRSQLLADASRLVSEIAALSKQYDEKTVLLKSRKEILECEQNLLVSKQKEKELLEPEITKARETKVEVNAKKSMLERLLADISTLEGNISKLNNDIETNSKNQQVEQSRLKDSEGCLSRLAEHRDMLDNEKVIKVKLTTFHSLIVKLDKDEKETDALRLKLETRLEKLASERDELQKSGEALAQEKLRIDEDDKQLRLVDITELQNKLTGLKDLIATLQEWMKLLKKKNELVSEVQDADKACSLYTKQQSDLEEEYAGLIEERTDIMKSLPGMERAYNLMSRESATQMRADLLEGQPCPVCGSTVHPYEQEVDHVLSPLKNEIETKRKRQNLIADLIDNPTTGITRRLTDLKAKVVREKLRKQQANKQLEETESRLIELQNLYPQISSGDLDDVIKSYQTQLKSVKSCCDEWVERERKLASARIEYDRRLKDHDKSGEKIDRKAIELEGERGQLNQRMSQLDSDKKVIDEKRKELIGVISIRDWLAEFDNDFEGFIGRFSQMCADYANAQAVGQSATAKIRELSVEAEGLRKQMTDKLDLLEKQMSESKVAQEEYLAKKDELQSMLNGKDSDELERELKSAISAQNKKVDYALENFHNLEVECAGLKAKEQAIGKQHEMCLTNIQGLRAKEGEDDIEDNALKPTIEFIAGKLENTDKERSNVCGLINAHENCQKKLMGYKSDLDARTKAFSDWRDLNSILGNANGDKLRETAQCFTLGFLVHQANAQLKTLGRRYALEQVKDTLGIRIIDHDRADEQRNVSSLSGGETFVISLALALGLSSISSRNIPIANLFVDEGFGSLDSDSLNMVIDALSSLESAQGKKVGVISHTPEMRERIRTQIRVVKTGSGGKSYIEIKS